MNFFLSSQADSHGIEAILDDLDDLIAAADRPCKIAANSYSGNSAETLIAKAVATGDEGRSPVSPSCAHSTPSTRPTPSSSSTAINPISDADLDAVGRALAALDDLEEDDATDRLLAELDEPFTVDERPAPPSRPDRSLHDLVARNRALYGRTPEASPASVTTIALPTPPAFLSRPWRTLEANEKFMAAIMVAAQHDAIAFSLNFSPKRLSTLQRSKDPTRALAGEIGRAARKMIGAALSVAFAFEFTTGGRLHAHGVALPPGDVDDPRSTLRAILKTAGGKITGAASGRQLDAVELYDSTGWTGYSLKSLSRTRRLLGTDKVIYVNDDLRRMAEAMVGPRTTTPAPSETAVASPTARSTLSPAVIHRKAPRRALWTRESRLRALPLAALYRRPPGRLAIAAISEVRCSPGGLLIRSPRGLRASSTVNQRPRSATKR